ncbi:unnamed protein product (macronuclear) [Paramecium tetraurelia]|uniref:Transmembrane protein n=1 Tax=Paramecium tetraurelia TaxID=5888 RepID=A0C4K1_PARTE|nr:uncharacterized protein GSPATT00006216001 [Paramecium tetraurelia]CAK65718.1 unnamed protein product [Paramecium tetraurelia]|eukprot:XP_001433115.1 hypothetical protein (macronuclear) [Paramecium tetraurelia strain d4-2]
MSNLQRNQIKKILILLQNYSRELSRFRKFLKLFKLLNLIQIHYINQAQIQNGLFISFNTFIPSGKNWNQNYNIVSTQCQLDDFMVEIQSALTRNFPFFLKNYANNFNQSQQQYNSIMSQVIQPQPNNYVQFQQSQFHLQQQQPSNNPYSDINQKQESLKQSEYKLKYNQTQKKQQEEQGMANKLIQIISSVFEFGRNYQFHKKQKRRKQKLKQNLKLILDCQFILKYQLKQLNSKNNQLILQMILIVIIYQQLLCLHQTRVIQEVQLKDQEINASIHQLDQQLMQIEQKIETCVTTISSIGIEQY